MIAYLCSGPKASRFESVKLRLVAYAPKYHPDQELLKCTLQVLEGKEPLAEYPLWTEFLTAQELAVAVSESRRDGWVMENDEELQRLHEHYTQLNLKARPRLKRKRKRGKASKK